MSLAIYVDVNVRVEVPRGLRVRGIRVLTSQEDGTREFSDAALLDRATELGMVLFTHDEDLLAEAAMRQRTGRAFAGVIYAHQLRVSIGQCVDDLELICQTEDSSQWINRVGFLTRK